MFAPIRQSLAHKVLDTLLTGRFRANMLTKKKLEGHFCPSSLSVTHIDGWMDVNSTKICFFPPKVVIYLLRKFEKMLNFLIFIFIVASWSN
jgi:hypothetical protein